MNQAVSKAASMRKKHQNQQPEERLLAINYERVNALGVLKCSILRIFTQKLIFQDLTL